MEDEKFDPNAKYTRHPNSHEKGGLDLRDKNGEIKGIVYDVLKSAGQKLTEGAVADVVRFSRPARVSYEKSFLQALAGDYYYTHFMDLAAETKDPVERIKYVTAFMMSGIHKSPAEFLYKGPMNPVLGETYEARKADGTRLYCEQISHHPPVTSFLLVGKDDKYRIYGHGEVKAKLSLSAVYGTREGKATVKFADGGKVIISNPPIKIEGLVVGDRRLNFIQSALVADKKNKVSAEISFAYEDKSTMSKIAGKFSGLLFGSKSEPPCDLYTVNVVKFQKKDGEILRDTICTGSGCWVSHMEIDGKLMWRYDAPVPKDYEWIEGENNCLMSDSTRREDIMLLKIKDLEKAQKEKEKIEAR